MLTRGGARPIGPGRWGERHGGHKRRDAVVPLVIARSLAPLRASRATRTPQSHSTLTISMPLCLGAPESLKIMASRKTRRYQLRIPRLRWLVFVSFVAATFVVASRTGNQTRPNTQLPNGRVLGSWELEFGS